MENNITSSPGLNHDMSVELYKLYNNNTTTGMYEFYEGPQIGFVSTLCVFIIIGNLCVLGAIRLSEAGRKSRMNFFILHLALSDLLVGILVSFTDLMSKITVEWYAGNVMCKLVNFLQGTVTYSSTYMLVSLSIDRYYAVARPMSFTRSGSQAKILVATAWIASFLFASPNVFLYGEEVWEGKKQCWIDFPEFWHWQLFFTIIAVMTFFIPTIIIASCYIAIIHIIWSKGRRKCHSRLRYNWLGRRTGASEPDRHMTISDSRHDTAQGIIPQAKIRTVKMTLIIVIVFILCWSPYFLYNLLELYRQIPRNNPVSTFIQSAAPLNSAANPIIYGIFSTRICRNLRRLPLHPLIKKALCCCKEKDANDRYYNSNYTKVYHHNHTEPTSCSGNGRRAYIHGNPKHTSLVVTANKKGYSSTKVTQFDSALNIESSTTTNSSEQYAHLEMNLILSKTNKTHRNKCHSDDRYSTDGDIDECLTELSSDKSMENGIISIPDLSRISVSPASARFNNLDRNNKYYLNEFRDVTTDSVSIDDSLITCQSHFHSSDLNSRRGLGDLVIVSNESDSPLKSVTSRRSSGLPVMKSKLSTNDSVLLNHVIRNFSE